MRRDPDRRWLGSPRSSWNREPLSFVKTTWAVGLGVGCVAPLIVAVGLLLLALLGFDSLPEFWRRP